MSLFKKIVWFILIWLVYYFGGAAILMVAFGELNRAFAAVPAIGYGESLYLAVGLVWLYIFYWFCGFLADVIEIVWSEPGPVDKPTPT